MSTTGCCRGLSARDCAARPNGCFDEPERVFPNAVPADCSLLSPQGRGAVRALEAAAKTKTKRKK